MLDVIPLSSEIPTEYCSKAVKFGGHHHQKGHKGFLSGIGTTYNRDMDPIIPAGLLLKRGLVTEHLLESEAPLLIIRDVECPDLVVVEAGPKPGVVFRVYAARPRRIPT